MTRHTRISRVFDMTQPLTKAEVTDFAEAFRAMGKAAAPWAWLEREVVTAEGTMRAIEVGAPGSDDPDLFKHHAGAGWYSQEILARAKWIENAQATGNWELVARFSFELGQLAAIILLKNAADDDVEAGARHRSSREAANAENRLATHAARKAIVQEIIAERGRGVRDACAIAAQRFGEMGTKSTFKESYYYKKAV